MESIEEIGFGGLKLIQSSEGFRFGIDAVLLADFAAGICPGADSIVDLGTGNGVIPLILSHKTEAGTITGIDLQAKAIDLARRSCDLNGLGERIRLVDLFYSCRKNGLEPKKIRFVAPRQGAKPNIVLLHCVKGGGRELDYADELYVYDEAGKYTAEIMKIYEKTR